MEYRKNLNTIINQLDLYKKEGNFEDNIDYYSISKEFIMNRYAS
jgi:hypothetical protein